MDKIILKNLAFYGYHGVLKEEKKIGQKFFFDIELYLDLKNAGKSDKVEDTVHYGQVYELVKSIVEEENYDLIEALAERCICKIFDTFKKIEEIDFTIKKPEAPVPGIYDYFGVSLRRKRNDY